MLDVIFHDKMQEHIFPAGLFCLPPSALLEIQAEHPDSPARILNIISVLKRGPLRDMMNWLEARSATDQEILQLHDAALLDHLNDVAKIGGYIESTTFLPVGGMEAVRLAAGAAIEAAARVMGGSTDMAYALTRPPGHHAQTHTASHYCLLNNCGLAAQTALNLGAKRVAIIDWDAHHGNGTQQIFYERGDVLTISLHMDRGKMSPKFEQTGSVHETGKGLGVGSNLNLPLPLGFGDWGYCSVFDHCVAPAVRAFKPDIIMVANGQDGNEVDTNARQCLSMEGFYGLAQRVRNLAQELCESRVVMTQEGGYNHSYGAYCAYASIAGLLGKPMEIEDTLTVYPEDIDLAGRQVDELIARHPLLTEGPLDAE